MINKETYAYAPTFDLYINRKTMIVYKRNNRNRKTEIQEDELVPLHLMVNHNGYYRFRDSLHNNMVGVQYAYADAFPDKVQGFEDHLADFTTFKELDHLHGHDSLESNYPWNLRWTSSRINRARTSHSLDLSLLDDKKREAVLKKRERNRKYREDPEWLANKRQHDAEYRRMRYAETKSLRKQQTDALNERIATMDAEYQLLCKKSGSGNPKT